MHRHMLNTGARKQAALHRNVAAFVAKPSTEEVALVQPQVKYTLKGPKAERFKIASGQLGNIAGSSLPLLFRAGTGVLVAGYKPSLVPVSDGAYTLAAAGGRMLKETSALIKSFKRPAKPIEMYEFQACPFCAKVREMASYLDLDILFKPCPAGGPTFRPEATAVGGKSSFPYMVDPNTGVSMYESDDIIAYLSREYGNGAVPLALRLGVLTTLTAGLGSIPRIGKGGRYRPSKMPAQPLIVWGYELSPFVRVVRERLVELELPHVFRNCARGSPKREEMLAEFGTYQVPFLQDPNTMVAMFESSAIVDYLEETYAIA